MVTSINYVKSNISKGLGIMYHVRTLIKPNHSDNVMLIYTLIYPNQAYCARKTIIDKLLDIFVTNESSKNMF